MKELGCPVCGKDFESVTSKIYCSLKCYLNSPKLKEHLKENGIKANQQQSLKAGNIPGKVKIKCLECGKERIEKPSRKSKFCNSICYRKYYSKRFDRWIASPQKIALPQNYDEFLTLEELPCLVEGCGWKGHFLSMHMNLSHGVKSRDFKRAAGFNYTSGIISLPLHENLINRAANNGNLTFYKHRGDQNPDKYISLERREHQSKSIAILKAESTDFPLRFCTGCGKPFVQSTIFGKTLYCSESCRNDHYYKKNMENKYHFKCGVCGKIFLGNNYQRLRVEKKLIVTCSSYCRQKRTGKISRGTWTMEMEMRHQVCQEVSS